MQCPLCRKETRLYQIPTVYNSEKAMRYLNEVKVEACERHELPLTYFCPTCDSNKPMCIYCYYYNHDNTHQLFLCSSKDNNNNNNKAFQSVYEDICKLKQEIQNKQGQISNVNDKIEEVNAIRNDYISFLNKLITYFNNKYNDIIDKLNAHKQTLQSEIESFNNQIKHLTYYQRKQRNNLPLSLSKIEIDATTHSCLSNIKAMNYFEEKKFTIVYDNLPSMFNKDICIVHKVIYIDLLKLAVCFFPSGNSPNKGESISIYLYILNTLDKTSSITLNMKIEMLTDDIYGVNYSKETKCTFTRERVAAGWLNYCEIDYINTKKFLTRDGQLQFNFYIQILDISSLIQSELHSLLD